MKRALVTVMLLVASNCAMAATSWEIPFWPGITQTSSAGNPYTDADLNQWAAYHATEVPTAAIGTNFVPMVWGGSGWPHWYDAASGGYGVYRNYGRLDAAGAGMAGQYVGAAIGFAPAGAGSFALTGSLYSFDSVYGSRALTSLAVGVLASDGTYNVVWEQTNIASGTTINLETIAALQNIAVAAGSELMIQVNPDYWTTNSVDVSNAGIKVVPEPATMALLGIGGLLAYRRRR